MGDKKRNMLAPERFVFQDANHTGTTNYNVRIELLYTLGIKSL